MDETELERICISWNPLNLFNLCPILIFLQNYQFSIIHYQLSRVCL